nr:MAG TPA: hypothetical protein [Caudoviricetes sp.]DAH97744.1 MAG TPA: hypothetical protein [Caudoviricetes sp.]DAN87433.1 MAG TPA: hypothetical protein [Caudoviricetes sp.]
MILSGSYFLEIKVPEPNPAILILISIFSFVFNEYNLLVCDI